MLDDNVMLIEFLEAEKLHCYYASDKNKLSTPMMALIGSQARVRAELVHKELEATTEWHKKRAHYSMTLVAQIYDHEVA